MSTPATSTQRADRRNAVLAGFLGWTLDAFDFFILTFVLAPVAKDFGCTVPDIAKTLVASLAMRPVGAVVFGLMADRYGRRLPLMINVVFYSVVEVLSGLAPNYATFFVLRMLYGIGMGGEWGVGASLVMESVPSKWRGIISGMLQEGYACGFLLAAAVYPLVYPRWGWRMMFFVGGLPALLSLFIRAKVKDPEAWHQSRTEWSDYWRSILSHWPRFLYLVALMTMMNFISHGTQDLYPRFLQKDRHFSVQLTSVVTIISMLGALCGGLAFGLMSDRYGRRRAMVTAVLLGAAIVPLWILAPTTALIVLGAFGMQFMVQGAWGVVPVHINELSPNHLRGFFPGLAYQVGVLCASSIGYFESLFGENYTYAQAMGTLATIVFLLGAVVIAVGPEAHGVAFGKAPES